MGIFDKLFGRKRASDSKAATDRARQQRVPGMETLQTADEQQATRGRMEAELDSQRDRRSQAKPPDA